MLADRRLVALEDRGKYPLWTIRRPGLSLALRSWGLPPGKRFPQRRERGRDACAERVADQLGKGSTTGRKKRVTFAGQEPVSFWSRDPNALESGLRLSKTGRHRRTARLWPAWLRRAWPQAQVWVGWSEVACGRTRPDALCWGRLEGYETLFWLEVESGNLSRERLQQKTVRRVNQALLYARRCPVRLVFVLLGPRWVLDAARSLKNIPGDAAFVLEDWREFGKLPLPEWGRLR